MNTQVKVNHWASLYRAKARPQAITNVKAGEANASPAFALGAMTS